MDLSWQSNVSTFNTLSRLVITFLLRSKRLLISWLQSPSAVILEPPKKSLSLFPLFPHLFAMKRWDQMPWYLITLQSNCTSASASKAICLSCFSSGTTFSFPVLIPSSFLSPGTHHFLREASLTSTRLGSPTTKGSAFITPLPFTMSAVSWSVSQSCKFANSEKAKHFLLCVLLYSRHCAWCIVGH